MKAPRPFLEAVINIRLTEEEKAFLAEEARLAGLTPSALGRRRLLGHKVVAYEAIVERNELRRLGGLLKLVHRESNGVYAKQTAALLSQLQERLRVLGA